MENPFKLLRTIGKGSNAGNWKRTGERSSLDGVECVERAGCTQEAGAEPPEVGFQLNLILEKIAGLESLLLEVRLAQLAQEPLEIRSKASAIDEFKVQRVLRVRRVREQLLGLDLFADPAWDILLAAFSADLKDETLLIDDLARASPTPASTALRWIAKLEQDGWLRRSTRADGSIQIALTEQGSAKLRRFFELIGPHLPCM